MLPNFPNLNSRIFWISQAYESVANQIQQPCFSNILWLFPYSGDCYFSQISHFCHRTLQAQGELRCITDASYYAQQLAKVFRGEAYRIVRSTSDDTEKTVPVSVYDVVLTPDRGTSMAILKAPIKVLIPPLAGFWSAVYLELWLEIAERLEGLVATLTQSRARSNVMTAQEAFDRIFN